MRSFIPQIISKAGINCIGHETPYGDNPFYQNAAHEEGNQVAAAQNLLAIFTNDSGEERTITIPAPQLHDGNALADRVFVLPASGVPQGVLFDPAYAGNEDVSVPAELVTNGDFSDGETGWDIVQNASVFGETLVLSSSQSEVKQEIDPVDVNGATLTFSAVYWSPWTPGGIVVVSVENGEGVLASINVNEDGDYSLDVPGGEISVLRVKSNDPSLFPGTMGFDNFSLMTLGGAPQGNLIPHMIRFECDGPDLAAVFLDVSGNAYIPPFQPVPGV